jgi:hypothetical protein
MGFLAIGYEITFLGKPLVLYLGMLTIFLLALQVFIAYSTLHLRKRWIPFWVHRKIGYAVLAVAAIYAALVSMYWWLA